MPTPPTIPQFKSSTEDPGLLWDEFCESLKGAGDLLRRPETPSDERSLAEGYRHLVRMIRVGFENAFELQDLDQPRLTPMVGPMVQYEGVTSDARYLHTFIDGAANHLISGTRGEAPLFEVGIYNGKMGIHDPSHLIKSITEETLEIGTDGRVEIHLGPDERPGNWLRTDSQTRYVMIRQYAADWRQIVEGIFNIERLGEHTPAPPFGLDEIKQGLERTSAFAVGNPLIWAEISDYWANFAVNRFVPQLDADAMTDIAPPSGHHFSCGYFKIAEDEALEIRFKPGEAAFWSLGLASYWYETIGYGHRESHLNSGSVVTEADGSVRVVISQQKPSSAAGIPNWIDPKGHCEGTLVFRWSRPKAPMPEIEAELKKRAAL